MGYEGGCDEGGHDNIWFNQQGKLVYLAIGAPGLIDVIDCDRLEAAERITPEQGAHTTAVDPERQRLYVFLPASSRAAVYEGA